MQKFPLRFLPGALLQLVKDCRKIVGSTADYFFSEPYNACWSRLTAQPYKCVGLPAFCREHKVVAVIGDDRPREHVFQRIVGNELAGEYAAVCQRYMSRQA